MNRCHKYARSYIWQVLQLQSSSILTPKARAFCPLFKRNKPWRVMTVPCLPKRVVYAESRVSIPLSTAFRTLSSSEIPSKWRGLLFLFSCSNCGMSQVNSSRPPSAAARRPSRPPGRQASSRPAWAGPPRRPRLAARYDGEDSFFSTGTASAQFRFQFNAASLAAKQLALHDSVNHRSYAVVLCGQ